tara:strand:+ start:1331 stop:1486 length:156 start_codon:yes stop_codon:yes gene_type:complete
VITVLTLLDDPMLFAPSPYRGPQRRHPPLVNAKVLKDLIDAQIEAFRRRKT